MGFICMGFEGMLSLFIAATFAVAIILHAEVCAAYHAASHCVRCELPMTGIAVFMVDDGGRRDTT